MPNEAIYYVDYIFKNKDIDAEKIIEIGEMDNLWGKDIDEAYVAVEDLRITKDMVTLMSPDKNPTLKIKINNSVSLIKFGSSQKEYESLLSEGYIKGNFIGTCQKNEWNGNVSAQILITDYELTDSVKYLF